MKLYPSRTISETELFTGLPRDRGLFVRFPFDDAYKQAVISRRNHFGAEVDAAIVNFKGGVESFEPIGASAAFKQAMSEIGAAFAVTWRDEEGRPVRLFEVKV